MVNRDYRKKRPWHFMAGSRSGMTRRYERKNSPTRWTMYHRPTMDQPHLKGFYRGSVTVDGVIHYGPWTPAIG